MLCSHMMAVTANGLNVLKKYSLFNVKVVSTSADVNEKDDGVSNEVDSVT